jgi:formylglycine-generating enzyme required for sulfatase activity
MSIMYTQVPRAVLWLLKGDEFQMGGAGGDTAPAHTVELESFYISRGPISNIQYEAFAPDFCRHPQSTEDDAPAAGLSFHQATAYAQWYADLAGKEFRLPSEAEWEFAARAMGDARYPWGDDPADGEPYAWTAENSGQRCHPVDTPRPSKAGLYGMIGNVWEWTASAYRPYPVMPGDGRDDASQHANRVIRGGSIEEPLGAISCHQRAHRSPDTADALIGFRIVRSL